MSTKSLYPNTFQHHNAYVDQISYLLTGNEEKVLNHIIREIIGFQDNAITRQAHIALSVLTDGKISTKTGERLSWGCGLKTQAVRNVLNTLCEFGLINKVGDPTPDGNCYELQLDWEALNWDAMYARKSAQDEAFKSQMEKARANNPLLLNKRGPVEQEGGGPVEQEGGGPVEQEPKNPSPNPSPNPPHAHSSKLDTFLGPRAEPVAPAPQRVDVRDPEARDTYLIKLAQQRAARYETEPWRKLFDWIAQPRNGIERDTLRRAAYSLTQAGIPEPQSDKARKEWLPALVAVYQEAKGDFRLIEQAGKAMVAAGLTYWPPHRWNQQIIDLKAQQAAAQAKSTTSDYPVYPERIVHVPTEGEYVVIVKGAPQ